MTEGLFDVEPIRRPRWKGSVALVPLGPRCPECGGELIAITAEQGALFRHGGYGATMRTTWELCLVCLWGVERQRQEVNPRRSVLA